MTFEQIDQLEMLLEKDILGVVAKGDIAPTDYQCLDKAVDIFKDLETIRAMWEYGTDENGVSGMVSGRSSYGNGGNSGMMPMYNSYGGGYSGTNGGNSYARGRSATTGQYVSRHDEVGMKLQNMMNNAQSEQERDVIARLMNEMGR